jgi:NADPH:quinone reductase-like Zn-dependent oxidoreductase
MKQVQIPRYGDPNVLRVIDRPDPEPKAGEVAVAVHAAGINFADIMARMGLYQDAPKPPLVVGYEVAGVIDAVGDGVDPARLGERVLAMTHFGGYSSRAVVADSVALPLPDGLDFEAGAALPVAYLTAYHMLIHLGNLHRGERVLIHSAGGGVGIAAIQLARWREAEIFGTASAGKHDRLRELGVHHCIDYRTEDFEEVIKRETGGKGVHIALDAVGGDSFKKSYRSLAKTGRLFCFGVSSFAPGQKRRLLSAARSLVSMPLFHPVGFMQQNKGVFGVNMGDFWDDREVLQDEMTALLDLYREGVIDPPVDRAFPYEQAAEAHRYIQERRNFGKVVLTFDA